MPPRSLKSDSRTPKRNQNVPDLLCFCHLRWDFVYQRPQHLMSRFASQGRVFYIEEPVIDSGAPRLELSTRECGVTVVVPRLPSLPRKETCNLLRSLLDDMVDEQQITKYCCWIYSPMAVEWTRHLRPEAVIYDCMDELSAFKNAPAEIKERERELMAWADVVFTGGQSLYEVKRHQHPNVYPFPSSIDVAHFAQARGVNTDPEDQRAIPHPRIGFFGVIDERMDLDLLKGVADLRPDWQLVIIGPVVKIANADLPVRSNIHYLGMKSYQELPTYIGNWDAAMLPFARNESTKFISPTKTPEYLAAGLPVVSTSIRDVINPYGDIGLVHIADTPAEFVAAAEQAMAEDAQQRMQKVNAILSMTSWARTWGRMTELIDDVFKRRKPLVPEPARIRTPLSRAARASGLSQGS